MKKFPNDYWDMFPVNKNKQGDDPSNNYWDNLPDPSNNYWDNTVRPVPRKYAVGHHCKKYIDNFSLSKFGICVTQMLILLSEKLSIFFYCSNDQFAILWIFCIWGWPCHD